MAPWAMPVTNHSGWQPRVDAGADSIVTSPFHFPVFLVQLLGKQNSSDTLVFIDSYRANTEFYLSSADSDGKR
jgi:hypothetical protein